MKKNGFVFLETVIILMLVTMALTTMLISYTLVTTKSYEKEFYDRISDKYLLYTISNLGVTNAYNYQKLADLLIKNASSSDNGEKLGILKIDVENKDCEIMCQSLYTKKCYCELSDCAGKTGQQKIECVNNCLNLSGIKNLESTKVYCSIMGLTDASCTLNGSNPAPKTQYKGTNHNTSSFDKIEGEDEDKGHCSVVYEDFHLVNLYFVSDIAYALHQDEATLHLENGTIEYMKTLRKCYDDVYITYENVVSNKPEDLEKCVKNPDGTCKCIRNNPASPSDDTCKVIRVTRNKLSDVDSSNGTKFICNNPIQYMIGVFIRNNDYYYASIEL